MYVTNAKAIIFCNETHKNIFKKHHDWEYLESLHRSAKDFKGDNWVGL